MQTSDMKWKEFVAFFVWNTKNSLELEYNRFSELQEVYSVHILPLLIPASISCAI